MTRRIADMAEDSKDQLQRKAGFFQSFAIALDESTDVSDTAQLLVFIRGVGEYFTITEELVEMRSLKGTTTGLDVATETIKALENIGLEWEQLSGITTDGAPSMVGVRSGAVTKIMQHARWTKPLVVMELIRLIARK